MIELLANIFIILFAGIACVWAIVVSLHKRKKVYKVDQFEVELHPAWHYICNDCGRDCYVKPTLYMPAEDELSDFAEEFPDMEPEKIQQTGLRIAPTIVRCEYCQTEARVEGFT